RVTDNKMLLDTSFNFLVVIFKRQWLPLVVS
ncbi:MAG: hypothetical protein ACI8UG_001208, partial [Gammaproteobacteria bacterium]